MSTETSEMLDALIEAGLALLATHPVFRLKPMGGEGSQARLEQLDQIAAEDEFRAALALARGEAPPKSDLHKSMMALHDKTIDALKGGK